MRVVAMLVVIVCGLVVIQAVADDTKPLTPVEAIKKVNEKVTVEMLGQAAGKWSGAGSSCWMCRNWDDAAEVLKRATCCAAAPSGGGQGLLD